MKYLEQVKIPEQRDKFQVGYPVGGFGLCCKGSLPEHKTYR